MRMRKDISGDDSDIFDPDWAPLYDQSIEVFFLGHALVINNPNYRKLYDKVAKNRELLGRYNKPQNLSQYKQYLKSIQPAWKIHQDLYPTYGKDEKLAQFTITVDLRAPDYLLKCLFEIWLKKIRKSTELINAVANFDQKKLVSWHKERLLPYLDLKAWAKLFNVNIPNRLFYKMLFIDDASGKSAAEIQRTVNKNAMKLMSEEYIFALQCEAFRVHFVKNFETK